MKLVHQHYQIQTDLNPSAILTRLERAGRTCYRSWDRAQPNSAERFIKMLREKGHESVLEHETIQVRFITDRGVTHELVRHRLASFSQESTRYCDYTKDKFDQGHVSFIIPSWVNVEGAFYQITWDKGVFGRCGNEPVFFEDLAGSSWFWSCAVAERDYFSLRKKGWDAQRARTVLNNSLKAEIVMTANLREWRKVLELRTAAGAHPQMQALMLPLLHELAHILPSVFGDLVSLEFNPFLIHAENKQ